jgi:predicted DNA-binding transcriptional regulator AlpA
MTETATPENALIDTREAATILCISPTTLAIWRCDSKRDQPQFLRVGKRSVRYSRAELARWIEARERNPAARKRRRRASK